MIKLQVLTMILSMSTLAVSQGAIAPEVITDPKQITARPDADVDQGEESLSLQRLYMTRLVGDTAWSPDGKSIVFVSNITGRNNLWLGPAEGGWPAQLTLSDQRQPPPPRPPAGQSLPPPPHHHGPPRPADLLLPPPTRPPPAHPPPTRPPAPPPPP